MNRRSLLLIEDDQNLSETVCDYLEEQGFAVMPVYDAEAAEEALYERRYDLILLDVNIPGLNGFELLKKLRNEGVETPAIYLTARQSVDDLEEGFRSGGDDYLRKPFALKELLIRIESLLERGFYHRHRDRITVGEGVEYDPGAQTLYGPEGEESLRGKEAKLLELFLRHPGEVLSHERIYGALWDYDEEPSDNALRTYVKNLRKRIGRERIVSLKKQGYRYVASE